MSWQDTENHMVCPFADDGAEMLPELTTDDMAWILTEVDPDWREHFADVDLAWGFYYPLNASEMDALAQQ